jgi:UDP-N-acetyl-2-amino-2-deoxyglucuronate dehydrogenase
MKKVKFALVGCGRVSDRYLEVFRDELADEAEICAICDIDVSKTERFADQLGAKPVSNLDGVLESEPDLVCILTESGNHAQHSRFFLDHGVNVISEKPITLRPNEAEELIELAQIKGLIYGVIKQNRYNPAICKVKSGLEAGRFGKIILAGIRVHWCRYPEYYQDGWHGTWALDGGVLSQQAIHHIDALRWLLGPVESVSARGDHLINDLEAEDTAIATMKFECGAMATLEATTAARPRDFVASLTIVGSGGRATIGGVALNNLEQWDFVEPQPDDGNARRQFSQDVPTGYGLGHGPYYKDVIKCIQSGNLNVPVDAQEGLKSLKLVHAFYASMEQDKWVYLRDNPVSDRLGIVNN